MKLSIIIPVLNSHEVVRRQLLYLDRLGLPDDVEVILVDDGSDPPIEAQPGIKVLRTNDTRPWTWALARNAGAREARGEYLLMHDIDHIVSADVIETARTFGGQKVQFKREFGILDQDGVLSQERDDLLAYGIDPKRIENGPQVPPLPNNFVMRRDVFWAIGGYREDRIGRRYPQGEDHAFKGAWQRWQGEGRGQVHTYRPTIYVMPNGYFCGDVDSNPFGLFHDLSRKSNANRHHRQLRQQQV